MIDRDKHRSVIKIVVNDWVTRREAKNVPVDELLRKLYLNMDAVIAQATIDGYNQGVQAVAQQIRDAQLEAADMKAATSLTTTEA